MQRAGRPPRLHPGIIAFAAALSLLLPSLFHNSVNADGFVKTRAVVVPEHAAAEACDSRTGDVGPVLLQKTVQPNRVAPPEDDEAPQVSNQAQSAAGLLEGLATAVGLINPMLESTEQEYVNTNDAVMSTGTTHGELSFSLASRKRGDVVNDPPELEDGNMISKAIGSDLLGDALDPTNHGENSKEHHTQGHSHGYVALLFLFGGLTLGSLILMVHERFLHQLPYTCLLFIAGVVIAFVHNLKPVHDSSPHNSWFNSVEMWEAINPHMLFYVFLPALVFSEAMKLNKQLVKTCFWQILLLAGPGVLMGTVMLGTFSHYVLPYGWDWPLCLVIGSILSATDPVAVVALFKTLGVSPRLTMLISGESLLNDGTAVVIFTLMLKVLLGAKLTTIDVVVFFGNMTIVSFFFGFVMATLALWVISCCTLERGHSDAMVQVIVTICCGYLCFFLAESELSTSGILSLVSAGFWIAYSAWPRFVSKEVVLTVWEAIEFVGNTMVFLLAGLLFADSCLSRIELIVTVDIFWLLVMYLACIAARAVMVLVFWIPLRILGKPLSWQEGVVLTWSGLRGAVSLAMAIIVDTEPAISKKMGTRVMFHVGGVAALTLLINAPTTSALLKLLGLTREPEERERMLQNLEKNMAEHTSAAFDKLVQSGKSAPMVDGESDLRFAGADPDIVRSMVPTLANPPSASAQSASAISSFVGTETAAARCAAYRQVFLQVVHNHYWESIEQGVIPRNNKVTQFLVGSMDEALVDVNECLSDWAHILPHVDMKPPTPGGLYEMAANFAQHPLLSFIPTLTQTIPSAEVIQTWKVYTVLSYQEAHRCARAEVPRYFDKDEALDQQVQEQVIEESLLCCKEASRLLEGVEESAVIFGRSRMLANKLLRLQLDETASLQKQGVVNASEGHNLDESIHNALLQLTRSETQGQRQVQKG